MTTPKISTISRGGSRLYVHPDTAVNVPGMTSVVNMLPKGFLKFRASKAVAEYAVDSPVPAPVAALLLEHIASRDNMNTTTNPASRWLFPGRRAGQPSRITCPRS